MKGFAVKSAQRTVRGLAESDSAFQHRLEHRHPEVGLVIDNRNGHPIVVRAAQVLTALQSHADDQKARHAS